MACAFGGEATVLLLKEIEIFCNRFETMSQKSRLIFSKKD